MFLGSCAEFVGSRAVFPLPAPNEVKDQAAVGERHDLASGGAG